VTAETEHGWRSPERRANAKRGIDQARRRLTICWDRKSQTWSVDGKTFATLLEAELYITRPEGVKE
jgi:hypothetical protein